MHVKLPEIYRLFIGYYRLQVIYRLNERVGM